MFTEFPFVYLSLFAHFNLIPSFFARFVTVGRCCKFQIENVFAKTIQHCIQYTRNGSRGNCDSAAGWLLPQLWYSYCFQKLLLAQHSKMYNVNNKHIRAAKEEMCRLLQATVIVLLCGCLCLEAQESEVI